MVSVAQDTPVRLTVLSDTAETLPDRGYELRTQLTVDEPVAEVPVAACHTTDVGTAVRVASTPRLRSYSTASRSPTAAGTSALTETGRPSRWSSLTTTSSRPRSEVAGRRHPAPVPRREMARPRTWVWR